MPAAFLQNQLWPERLMESMAANHAHLPPARPPWKLLRCKLGSQQMTPEQLTCPSSTIEHFLWNSSTTQKQKWCGLRHVLPVKVLKVLVHLPGLATTTAGEILLGPHAMSWPMTGICFGIVTTVTSANKPCLPVSPVTFALYCNVAFILGHHMLYCC